MVRTTLNLDESIVRELSARAREAGRSVSRVTNDLLQLGLRAAAEPQKLAAYAPPVVDTGPPLLDVSDVSEALEQLGDG